MRTRRLHREEQVKKISSTVASDNEITHYIWCMTLALQARIRMNYIGAY